MRSKRRILLGVAGLVLAIGATVLPSTFASAGPEKVFDLRVTPTATAAGATGVPLTATFRNVMPTGISTINSLRLSAPAGFLVTGATGIANEVVASDGRSVSVTSIPPVKPGKSYVLNLIVSTAAGGCTTTGSWAGPAGQGVMVWTGSSLSGDLFRFVPETSSVTTTITAANLCTLRFVSGRTPADAIKNTTITSASLDPAGPPVQVELADPVTGVVATSFMGSVTLSKTNGPGTVTGNTATASNGVATFPTLQIDTEGTYRLQASSGSFTSDPSPEFSINDGTLGCEPGNNTATERGVTVTRLANADGSPCVLIPYILTRDGNSITFLKDLLTQTEAQFVVEVNAWDPEPAQNPVPPTTVDTPSPTHDIQWCNGTIASPVLPGIEVTCLLTQSTTIVGGGQMQVSETFYLKGDIKWQR